MAMLNMKDIAGRRPPTGGGRIAGIDLSIRRGDFVIVDGGPSSGILSLLRLIGLLERPAAGSYEVEGRETRGLGDRELASLRARHFGFLFAECRLIDELRALDNVLVPMAYASMPKHLRSRRAGELLRRVGLEARAHDRAAEFSPEERRELALARALANDPRCLIAERTGEGLEEGEKSRILNLLGDLHDEGLTIVATGEAVESAFPAARHLRLAGGRVVEAAPTAVAPEGR